MADKQQENPSETTQLPPRTPGSASKSKALVVSVVSFSLLIVFALWTLIRTDFTTYPDAPEIDIVEVTRSPDSLYGEADVSLRKPSAAQTEPAPAEVVFVTEDSASTEPPETTSPEAEAAPEPESLVDAEETESPLLLELEYIVQLQQREMDALKADFSALEQHLGLREAEITALHQELESARQAPPIVALAEVKDEDSHNPALEELTGQTEQLQKNIAQLEQQLADTQKRLKATQDVVQQSDNKAREADARARELAKRQESMLKERSQLEDKIEQQQAKLTAQERSFQELSNAIKSHRQAMKQMDQARMELASELDITKNQYAKLLQAVAIRNSEAIPQPDPRSFVAATNESPLSPSTSPEQDVRYHVVGKGDTLTSISRHYYGTAQRWHEVYEANKAVLTDQNRLKVGLVLVIP